MVSESELRNCYIDTQCSKCNIKSYYTMDKFIIHPRTRCVMCGGKISITNVSGMSSYLYLRMHRGWEDVIQDIPYILKENFNIVYIKLLHNYLVRSNMLDLDTELINVFNEVEQW